MNWTLNVIIFLCIISVISGILYFIQEKFIFINGKKLDRDYQYKFANTFEEVFIKTDANNEINALHFKLPNPKGVVLFCHGNKGNLTRWGNRVSYLLAYNYEVLVFDYRNYGKSTGNFNEQAMYKDACLVYNHLKKSFKEEYIVVYGFSLGATFATRIAALNKPKELVLEAPFYNLRKAVQFVFPFAPVFLLKFKFNTNHTIPLVSSPITIFHGTHDKTTSYEDAKTLLRLNTSSKMLSYLLQEVPITTSGHFRATNRS